MCALAIWAALAGFVPQGHSVRSSSGALLAGSIVGFIAAGLVAPFIVRSAWRSLTGSPVVTFDERGITDHYSNMVTARTFIPWTNVAGVRAATVQSIDSQVKVAKNNLIIIELIDVSVYDAALPIWQRGLLGVSRKMGFPPNITYLSSSPLIVDSDELIAAAQRYMNRTPTGMNIER